MCVALFRKLLAPVGEHVLSRLHAWKIQSWQEWLLSDVRDPELVWRCFETTKVQSGCVKDQVDSNIDHPSDVEHTEYSRGSRSAHSEAPAADWCGWPAMQVRAVVVLGFTCDHDRAVPSPALKRRFFF